MGPAPIDRYGGVSKFLHWLVAGLVFLQLAIGKFFKIDPARPDETQFNLHMWVGLTVLGLMVVRLIWRLGYTAPLLPKGTPAWQRIAARSTQGTFYLLLLALPVSGWLLTLPRALDVVGKDLDREVHEVLGNVLLVLAAFHVLAGLKHHFIDRDDVLRRMLPGRFSTRESIGK
jgi:cytochrome b561